MTSFYLFQDYDVIPPMTPHPDDVTILFLDYDVSIFDEVNPWDIVKSSTPYAPGAEPLLLSTYLSRYNSYHNRYNLLVTPPNSNAFSDWRRRRHVPWVKSL